MERAAGADDSGGARGRGHPVSAAEKEGRKHLALKVLGAQPTSALS
jgi:hypothetical protein